MKSRLHGRVGRRTMLALIDAFMKIALRRLGPEDLPDSALLLALALAAYLLLQVVIALPVFGGISWPMLRNLAADLALLAGGLWLLLAGFGLARRYRQTLTAMLGTAALLALVALPVYLLAAPGGPPAEVPVLPQVLLLAVLVWSVLVNGHILSRALSVSPTLGVAIALSYMLLNIAVNAQFGPGA